MSNRDVTLTSQIRVDETKRDVAIRQAVIAGWTGRDPKAVEAHVAELEAIGVRRPASTPIFYWVAAARLTTNSSIEAIGTKSSGEVEFVLLQFGGLLWVGVGSDHTDREVETYSVTVSKQLCDKPIATEFWRHEDVVDHWDKLILRSHIVENGKAALYQEGYVAAMLDPASLISRFGAEGRLAEGTLMFCGTLVVPEGVRPAEQFQFELEDPVFGRKIEHRYHVLTLPILG